MTCDLRHTIASLLMFFIYFGLLPLRKITFLFCSVGLQFYIPNVHSFVHSLCFRSFLLVFHIKHSLSILTAKSSLCKDASVHTSLHVAKEFSWYLPFTLLLSQYVYIHISMQVWNLRIYLLNEYHTNSKYIFRIIYVCIEFCIYLHICCLVAFFTNILFYTRGFFFWFSLRFRSSLYVVCVCITMFGIIFIVYIVVCFVAVTFPLIFISIL